MDIFYCVLFILCDIMSLQFLTKHLHIFSYAPLSIYFLLLYDIIFITKTLKGRNTKEKNKAFSDSFCTRFGFGTCFLRRQSTPLKRKHGTP